PLRLLTELHSGSLTLADTWRGMFAPANAETVMVLAAEAGQLVDQARSRLGLAGDGAPSTATTLEMGEALAAFHFPDDLWARLVYDLVVAARPSTAPIEQLVAALVPPYFGRVGRSVRGSSHPPTGRAT